MAAVIRVKRLLDEPSADALYINCKRRKLENSSTTDDVEPEELSAIVKFAGTFENQDATLEHIKKPSKTELEEEYKKHRVNLTGKLREQLQLSSKTSRYKLINCFRSLESDPEVSTDSECNYTIYDVEADRKEPSKSDDNPQYVYDLYYTSSDYLGDDSFNEFLSIYPLSNDLIYGSLRDNGYNVAESEDDSEDSNAENNWRNDYPDESDVESITEEDMVAAMKRCNCDGDSLSSEDDFYNAKPDVSSFDFENDWSDHDVDDEDVDRFGEQYAKFKAKTKQLCDTSSSSSTYYDDAEGNINDYYY